MLYRRLRTALQRQDWLAYLIELVIVVLGITIAYQLNVYQQHSSEQKMKAALLENLRVENQRNYEELHLIKSKSPHLSLKMQRLIELLEKEEIAYNTSTSLTKLELDTINQFLHLVKRRSYYVMRDSYLTTYLNFMSKTGVDQLSNELFNLQSLYKELGMGVANIIDYKNQKLLDYLDGAFDRSSNSYSLSSLRNNSFRNKVMMLTIMENEQQRIFNIVVKQVEKIDSLLSLK